MRIGPGGDGGELASRVATVDRGRRSSTRSIAGSTAAPRGLVVVLVGCFVGVLSANPAEARVSNRDVTRSLRIAHDYWASMTNRVKRDGYHCERGNASARWMRDMGGAMASARIGGCVDAVPTVYLEEPTIRRLDDDHACAVLTHEFGHLLGYLHNRTRGSIMHSSTSGSRSGPDVPRGATWDKAYRKAYCGRF